MERKPPPDGDEARMSEEQLEAMQREQAALVELSQAADDARSSDQDEANQGRECASLFHRFVQEQSSWLRRLATRLVGRNDGDDVAQEAFVSFMKWNRTHPPLRVLELLRSTEQSRALVYTITARRAYEHLRRRERRTDHVTSDGAEIEHGGGQPVMPCAGVGLELECLEAAYSALPPMQRIAHVLHHHYGLTDAELAETLGTSKTNSRTLVFRANRALKSAMEMKQ
jgi:DNA-directed RNA polymerase specialized sigma24 family protein